MRGRGPDRKREGHHEGTSEELYSEWNFERADGIVRRRRMKRSKSKLGNTVAVVSSLNPISRSSEMAGHLDKRLIQRDIAHHAIIGSAAEHDGMSSLSQTSTKTKCFAYIYTGLNVPSLLPVLKWTMRNMCPTAARASAQARAPVLERLKLKPRPNL